MPDERAGRHGQMDDAARRGASATPSGSSNGMPGRDDGPYAGGVAVDSSGLQRLLVENMSEYAIYALDPDGYIMSWNVGGERLKGYAANEVIGRHFSMFYPAADVAAGLPARELEQARREGRSEEEGWRVRKDGTRFWANLVLVPLRDEQGTLLGFAKVTRDLTERRHAEETLRRSEERFRLLVQGVRGYAIFMLDTEGRVASWNAGARAIKGYEAEEIIGRSFATFYPQVDLDAGKPAMELEVATREGKYEEEGWRIRKDGTQFWAHVLITAMRASDGTLIGFAKVTQDLTERRATEIRRLTDERRVAEAEASSRTKSEFLTAMSHELRTPINATMGYAELLDMEIAGPVTARQREYLARIRHTQEHLLGIITDLLNYGRIEAGQERYTIEPVSAALVMDTVAAMIEPQAARKGIVLDRVTCGADVRWRADRLKAEQIVLNLLSNAAKFTHEGGHIVIRCEATPDRVMIHVTDSGPGIAPEQQAAIFEPFVQLGRTLTSGHEGTGLGLAIGRDMAHAMGGDLTVESAPGQGSTFTLSLERV